VGHLVVPVGHVPMRCLVIAALHLATVASAAPSRREQTLSERRMARRARAGPDTADMALTCLTIAEIEGSLQRAKADIDAILKENHKEIVDGQEELRHLLSEVDKFTFDIVEVRKE
jgi:hypothetical protein